MHGQLILWMDWLRIQQLNYCSNPPFPPASILWQSCLQAEWEAYLYSCAWLFDLHFAKSMQTATTYNLTPDFVLVIGRMLQISYFIETIFYNFSWFMQHSTISCWYNGKQYPPIVLQEQRWSWDHVMWCKLSFISSVWHYYHHYNCSSLIESCVLLQ